jgi:hypothetical protein
MIRMNDGYRKFMKENPDSKKSFMEYRKEFIHQLKLEKIEKDKKYYAKHGRKIRALEKKSKKL